MFAGFAQHHLFVLVNLVVGGAMFPEGIGNGCVIDIDSRLLRQKGHDFVGQGRQRDSGVIKPDTVGHSQRKAQGERVRQGGGGAGGALL